MPDTQIGAGKTLDDLTIGLDTVILNESKHWYRDPDTKRLYAKCKVVKDGEDGSYQIFLTGEAETGLSREKYHGR